MLFHRSLILLLPAALALAQSTGQALFSKNCAFCHGANAQGGERAGDITTRGLRTRDDLPEVIRKGIPDKGMPSSNMTDAEITQVVEFLKSLGPTAAAPAAATGIKANGPTLEQVVHARAGSWPTYHGNIGGNRHSPLAQITAANVNRLAPAWMFSVPGAPRLQVTPVVFDGVMYVTAPNEAYALDPKNGRTLWSFRRPRTRGLAGDAASGINRGVAILGHRLFLVTDHAHLLALDRTNGRLLWDVEMADYRQNYGATSAPLVAGGVVISGHSGGDEGARGFLAAYKPETGERVWRFWTIPAPGEPGSETWKGKDWEHGCATTWLTGTYDPSLNLLFWPTGNPCPDYNGDERQGDNLYSNTVLALDPASGTLKWHFQFTPHDLHDWDATQTPMVVDYKGRKLLVQANRNGNLYLLDRTTGKLIYSKPFVKLLTVNAPTAEGVKSCPAVEGATNWFSTAFHPGTGLLYLQVLEKCSIYSKAPADWKAGQSHYGGDTKDVPGEPGKKYLRAIDLESGKLRWEIPQDGLAVSWGGVLSTAGGVVFFGHDGGDFAAADANTGKLLWRFPANQLWKSSPMTYTAGGRQYVVTAAGSNILAFSLK
jgi:alcohol dehydrogenase (cytochrome c)